MVGATTLLIIGILSLLAAVIGKEIDIRGVKFPAVAETSGRIMVACVGLLALGLGSLTLRVHPASNQPPTAMPPSTPSISQPPTDRPSTGTPSTQSPPSTTTTTPPSPSPTVAAQGTIIAHYTGLQVKYGDGIPLQAGGAPMPTGNDEAADLMYNASFYSRTGVLAFLQTAHPTYQACIAQTVTSTSIATPQPHETICYIGNDVVGAATVESYTPSQGIWFTTLDVTVWQK